MRIISVLTGLALESLTVLRSDGDITHLNIFYSWGKSPKPFNYLVLSFEFSRFACLLVRQQGEKNDLLSVLKI